MSYNSQIYGLLSYGKLKTENISETDSKLAELIKSIGDIYCLAYCHEFDDKEINYVELMPKTKAKVNEVISTLDINLYDIGYQLTRTIKWMTDSSKRKILVSWLNQKDCRHFLWILDYFYSPNNDNTELNIINKLLQVYSFRKYKQVPYYCRKIFNKTGQNCLKEVCDLLADSTPAISVCLLDRNDIDDKYILVGLKSLAKLSTQRSVAKLDFELLWKLSPKSRLKAIKQLLGMLDRQVDYLLRVAEREKKDPLSIAKDGWISNLKRKYNKEFELPFKTIPTKEEIERFLFPCVLKDNNEVSKLILRYEILTNNLKEQENGVCSS